MKDNGQMKNGESKKRVFVIHRWSGGANDDWRPWLKEKLEEKGCQVFGPEMPDTDEPKIKKWVGKLSEIVGTPTKNDYFIGHSIGNQAILRFLETIDQKIGGAVFVAGWFNLENLEDEEVAAIAKPWMSIPIDIEKIKQVLPRSTLIISDNDPYDAFEFNKQKFGELGSKIIIVPQAGHFTEDDGFTELPVVLEELEKMK